MINIQIDGYSSNTIQHNKMLLDGMYASKRSKSKAQISNAFIKSNNCNDRSMAVLLPALLRNYARQTNRPTDVDRQTDIHRSIAKLRFQII